MTDRTNSNSSSPQKPVTRYLGAVEVMHLLGNISRSTLYNGIKTGRYPTPFKVSKRLNGWKAEDIQNCIDNMMQTELKQ